MGSPSWKGQGGCNQRICFVRTLSMEIIPKQREAYNISSVRQKIIKQLQVYVNALELYYKTGKWRLCSSYPYMAAILNSWFDVALRNIEGGQILTGAVRWSNMTLRLMWSRNPGHLYEVSAEGIWDVWVGAFRYVFTMNSLNLQVPL